MVKYKFDVNKFVQTEKNWYKDQTIETPVFSNINGDYKLIRTERGLTPIGEKRLSEQTKLIWDEKKDKKVAGSNMTLAEQFGTYENFKENVRNAVTPPPTQSVRSPQQNNNYGYGQYQPTYDNGNANIMYYVDIKGKDGEYGKVEGSKIIESLYVDDKNNKFRSAPSDKFKNLLPESEEAAANENSIFAKGGEVQFKFYEGVLAEGNNGGQYAWVRVVVKDKSDTTNPDKEQSYLVPFNDVESMIPKESNIYKWAKSKQKTKTTTTQKPSTPKQTFPEWKKSNPTGTYAQYQQYLKS